MIRPDKTIPELYIYRKPVDFRKAVNGLSVLIEYELKMDPFKGLYVFFNRRRDKIKILVWESNGYILFAKYLEQSRFTIPKSSDDIITITGEQLNWLLDGINIDLIKRHQAVIYKNTG